MCRLKECSNSTAIEDVDDVSLLWNSAGDIYSDEEDLSDNDDGSIMDVEHMTTYCPDPVEELEIESSFS